MLIVFAYLYDACNIAIIMLGHILPLSARPPWLMKDDVLCRKTKEQSICRVSHSPTKVCCVTACDQGLKFGLSTMGPGIFVLLRSFMSTKIIVSFICPRVLSEQATQSYRPTRPPT